MAAPAGRDRKENQPYDDGGGYGKFRKRPFRKGQATPYDRPSTTIRNSGLQTANGSGNGWLSKLVDPAQRLISSGAHRLFASLLRKRLPPPPPPTQPPEPEAGRDLKQKQLEAISKSKQVETVPMLSSKAAVYSQGEPSHMHDRPSSSLGGAITDLESMLQQKNFTRHEIDRLTALLQSRVVDLPVENEKKSEFVPPNSFQLHDKEFPSTPVKYNGTGDHLIASPDVRDQDVASPAELAKAYMGSRPSKVSPSMLALPSQPWKDDSAPQVSKISRPKGSTTSAIYKSSGKAGLTENFMTPRSRGKSAVYSMARTPYSRTLSTTVIQGAGTSSDAFGGRGSSYQSTLENGRFSGSKQGTLKRRSSVLESDIGSPSPIRRIRQKSNLMSAGALAVRGTRSKSDPEEHLALTSKSVTKDEPSKENGDYSIQNPGFTPVSSKSSEMASKILQQLDVLVSSREKSPAKLSPSMLRGQALRSLEKIDSSKFLETVQNNTQDNARNSSVLDAERFRPEKEDRIEQNGQSKVDIDGGKAVASTTVEKPNPFDAGVVNTGIKFSGQAPKLKKPGFRMSANEDFLEFDDDDDSVGNTSTGCGKGHMKLSSTSDGSKADEAAVVDKTPVLSGANPLSSSILSKKDTATQNGSTSVGSSSTFAFATPLSTEVVKHAIPSKAAAVSDNAAIVIFSSGGKTASRTEVNDTSEKFPLFSSVPSLTVANNGFSTKFGASSGSQLESSQRVLPVAAVADPSAKQPDGNKYADTNKPVVSFKTSETQPSSVLASSSAAGMFSFGSGLQNGTVPGSSTGQTLSDSSLSIVPDGSTSTDISVNAVNSGSSGNSASEAAPILGSSIFKFGSHPTSSSVSFANASGDINRSKTETSFGSLAGDPFADSKPAVASTRSGLFGIAPSIAAESTTSSSPSNDISATSDKSTLVSSPFGSTNASTGSNLVGATAASVTVTSNSPLGGSTPTATNPGSSIFGTAASSSTGKSLFSAAAPSTPTGNSLFSFSANSTSLGLASQTQGLNNTASTKVAATGFATSTQCTPSQFGSSVSSPFGLSANTAPATADGSSGFGSSSIPNPFSTGTSSGVPSSTPSSESNKSVSTNASTSSPLFGSSWSTTPVFGSVSSSPASSSGFVFGVSSSSGASTAGATAFGSSANATSSSSPFSFSAPAANPPPSQPVFGNPTTTPSFAFGSTPSFGSTQPSVSNDQMGMEDSMAEDTVQATTPSIPLFGQQTAIPPSSGFIFGSAASPTTGNPLFGSTAPLSAGTPQFGSTAVGTPQFVSTAAVNAQFGPTAAVTPQFGSAAASPSIPFQFGGQPTPQAAPFQASSSLEYAGSFSLGTGDKSNRRIVKVRKSSRKK
ncbi:unnamed protein product [Linum tenue]|uniref:Nuclear pore complex protein NUP1 n=1 Tax=Linum tenue TaxID=586396 RepID=A0AAV0JKZ5_9ROSI|nr:unnamed protein product [Linum tenue]